MADKLNELSKTTLGKYRNVAARDFQRHERASEHGPDWKRSAHKEVADKRLKGLAAADDRLSGSMVTKAKKGAKMYTRKKYQAEETEINELSKKTLGSYVNKAAQDLGNKGYEMGRKKEEDEGIMRFTNRNGPLGSMDFRSDMQKKAGTDPHSEYKRHEKFAKRMKGVQKATGRLTKEENDMSEDTEKQEMFGPGVSDLVLHALTQKPLEFQQTFNDLLAQRIADAVHERKVELAGNLAEPEEEPVEIEEPEDAPQEGEEGEEST